LYEIALRGGSIDGDQVSESGAKGIELIIHIALSHDVGLYFEGILIKLRKFEIWPNIDLNRDDKITREILVAWPLGHIGLGAAEGSDFLFSDSNLKKPIEPFADGVVQNFAAANSLVDEGRWNLAFAKTRDLNLFRDVLVSMVKAWLELLWGDGDT
jgi:hypothetical protein